MLLYMGGHGLVKASLFMVSGILLAMCGGIDELRLQGQGASVWPAGLAMAGGGLMLAGLPLGLMGSGFDAIATASELAGQRWLWLPLVACNALTGAAVLRAAGRIFLGWGQTGGEEDQSPTDDEREKADRPLWLMLLPTLVMLASACLDAGAGSLASSAASMVMGVPSPTGPEPAAPATLLAWLSVGLALAFAAYALSEHRLPRVLTSGARRLLGPASAGLNYLHSGAIGDYVAWLVVGLALFTAASWLA